MISENPSSSDRQQPVFKNSIRSLNQLKDPMNFQPGDVVRLRNKPNDGPDLEFKIVRVVKRDNRNWDNPQIWLQADRGEEMGPYDAKDYVCLYDADHPIIDVNNFGYDPKRDYGTHPIVFARRVTFGPERIIDDRRGHYDEEGVFEDDHGILYQRGYVAGTMCMSTFRRGHHRNPGGSLGPMTVNDI
ncbi:MAG: hypothetical protein UV80_C0015G0007 [Candidatus Peregrinibacteria bacterium GW2011_GWF2_43_17]|nr:MAG: hypothetical protein UV80_C0015G0007 [Candidatus Peregrinibacteria bacterium GW2011_GWF2_43_17]KKT19947.1 MAG: hypothetical protein UW03_C0012G0016 [Candidatus Peregrinibacteria bacterium GW2011_GWA2_43_8]HAU40132.1 hypothetical protein [Candidatus Peregrinibacteria bacterium]